MANIGAPGGILLAASPGHEPTLGGPAGGPGSGPGGPGGGTPGEGGGSGTVGAPAGPVAPPPPPPSLYGIPYGGFPSPTPQIIGGYQNLPPWLQHLPGLLQTKAGPSVRRKRKK